MKVKLTGDVSATVEVATESDIPNAIKTEFEKHEEVSRTTVWKLTGSKTFENEFGHAVDAEIA